ncbi:adenylyl-sulfate kinase [Paraburkholderia dipogonis]|uniref:Adenylyl-sulfate kinase n=1 Tax=Paraburkholderia dipogonis TaxID=1211383 RepID=A0A4Y8MIV7_9BURK|nr:adenylyl-sulfate kinase [Paraburkholderia dipogonis]TFE37314.1 adenylyl-sulfate kinase [Paraburkholderia dipogonis]
MDMAHVIWLTGLSGAGKTTLANALRGKLQSQRVPSIVLDGDALRTGINSDLGFSAENRAENVRRVAEIAKLMASNGHVAIVALISPLEAHRQLARSIVGEASFLEVHVATSVHECEKRDVKGLYKRARLGQIEGFTGLSAPYEVPLALDCVIDTALESVQQSADRLYAFLVSRVSTESKSWDYALRTSLANSAIAATSAGSANTVKT